jgi:mRNA-degrading endonuclease toxin of MazEF toxin-antitoxin module
MKEKYTKDFNRWNQKKQEIDVYDHGRQCHEGQIWVMSFGVNIGREIDGKDHDFVRPVLVVKRINRDTFIGVPLTKTRKDSQWYVPCVVDSKEGSINISQVRLFDQKRLLRFIQNVDSDVFITIKEKLRSLFE